MVSALVHAVNEHAAAAFCSNMRSVHPHHCRWYLADHIKQQVEAYPDDAEIRATAEAYYKQEWPATLPEVDAFDYELWMEFDQWFAANW